MATEDQDKDKQAAPQPLGERGAARRRLAKAGIGAAGILYTLESRAGMSAMMCKSPSGSLSGGLATSHRGPAPVCRGLSPGYWKRHTNWPCDRNTMFADVFYVPGDRTTCKPDTQSYLCASLLTILGKQSYDKYNLGMHLVATYLNVLSGRISFLTVESLTDMWQELVTTGHYSPTSGVYWSPEQVKNYLQSTHD